MHNEDQAVAQLSLAPWPYERKKKANKKSSINISLASAKNVSHFGMSAHISPLEIDVSSANNNNPNKQQRVEAGTMNGQQEVAVEKKKNLLQWNKEDKNDVLMYFFVGYVLVQIPAGRAAEIHGPKALFLWLAIGSGVGSLVFPWASSTHIYLAYLVRFIIGTSQAGMFPAAYVILCNWLPKNERSSWLAVPSACGRIGTIAMNITVPFLLDLFDWETVFYASGLITLAWGVLFSILASDTPGSSGWISKHERFYIDSRIGEREQTNSMAPTVGGSMVSTFGRDAEKEQEKKLPQINWLRMVNNRALLVLALVMFTSEWSNTLLLVKLPGFLSQALKMELKDVSMWSSLLVAVYCVLYPFSGWLASRIEDAQIDCLNSLRVRKLFELSAHAMQATGCLMIAFCSDKVIVLIALFLLMIGRSAVGGGQCLMPPELSRDYTGSVVALSYCLANTAGILGPKVVTLLVHDERSHASWRNLWLVSAALFAFAGLMFLFFATNKPQNYGKKAKNKSMSQADLCTNGARQAEEIIRMDSFARVANEPTGGAMQRAELKRRS